jgi:hypothetical protein
MPDPMYIEGMDNDEDCDGGYDIDKDAMCGWEPRMKITEQVERDCCDLRMDLKPYRGISGNHDHREYRFCVHCGQLWVPGRYADAAGGRSTEWLKVVPSNGKIIEEGKMQT